jgi:hypothetical protein
VGVPLKRLLGTKGAGWLTCKDTDEGRDIWDSDNDGRSTCGNWTRGLGTDGGRQADDDATGDTEDPATEGLVGAC